MIVIEFLKIIFSKNFWTYPQKSKNLIIDSAGADELFASSILKKNETLIVDLDHYRWANFFTLIHAFWKRPGMLFQDKFCFVFLSYIELANVRNVITWMDYIIPFYRLKNFRKEPQYISIKLVEEVLSLASSLIHLKSLGINHLLVITFFVSVRRIKGNMKNTLNVPLSLMGV